MSKRILLVDDEVDFTTSLSRLLLVRGYEVEAVNNGNAALRLLGEAPFDAVVLDLKMPGMDGITTLDEIQQLGLFTQTIILTGYGTEETAERARKMGAHDFLSKPMDIEVLLESIESAVHKKSRIERKTDLDQLIRS
ncbi:MAG: response regulator [Deltaproteobacteria bacterium HGW-Deltaproteobacteria-15]|jgi:DNA-binding NtrC family response regulator|nr:MAG: response regulator [Deltaproteobacteria bacterium HGW-Deltaproteobacteria-15]